MPLNKTNYSEVAKKTGLSLSYVSRICRGVRKNPSAQTLMLMAKAMGLTVEELAAKVKMEPPKKTRTAQKGRRYRENVTKRKLEAKE